MDFPFLKKETIGHRTQYTFTGKECNVYVSDNFMQNPKLAQIIGDRLQVLGMYWFEVDGEFYELQIPVLIEFEFRDKYNVKGKRLKPNLPPADYTVFVIKHGDAFVYDINHKKDADDIKLFINSIIENGKIPSNVSYNDAFNILMKMFMTTEIYGKLGAPALSYEILISELYRSKRDLEKPFRITYTPDRPYDYQMIRITKIPQVNQTFTGIIGEDINTEILSGIVRTRGGKEVMQRESPLEKTIKY